MIKGRAPLLISRAALQTLKATIDFGKRTIRLFEDQREMPLDCNSAGQLAIALLQESKIADAPEIKEALMSADGEADSTISEMPEDCPADGNVVVPELPDNPTNSR